MFRKDCNHDQSKVKIILKSHVKSSVKFENMGYHSTMQKAMQKGSIALYTFCVDFSEFEGF